jgi:hypothetical protein
MRIYVIEQVPSNAFESFHRKWKRKHSHHPDVAAATKQYILRTAPTPQEWRTAVDEFLAWYNNIQLEQGEFVVLCLSVHGAPTSQGIRFDEHTIVSTWDALGALHKRLRKDIVILQSICWGAYPDITRFMNHPNRGPVFTFGPTMKVAVGALHTAEREVLKFLANGGFDNNSGALNLIDEINKYGSRSPYKGHENFYRLWYFEHQKLKRHPECLTTKPVKAVMD